MWCCSVRQSLHVPQLLTAAQPRLGHSHSCGCCCLRARSLWVAAGNTDSFSTWYIHGGFQKFHRVPTPTGAHPCILFSVSLPSQVLLPEAWLWLMGSHASPHPNAPANTMNTLVATTVLWLPPCLIGLQRGLSTTGDRCRAPQRICGDPPRPHILYLTSL